MSALGFEASDTVEIHGTGKIRPYPFNRRKKMAQAYMLTCK